MESSGQIVLANVIAIAHAAWIIALCASLVLLFRGVGHQTQYAARIFNVLLGLTLVSHLLWGRSLFTAWEQTLRWAANAQSAYVEDFLVHYLGKIGIHITPTYVLWAIFLVGVLGIIRQVVLRREWPKSSRPPTMLILSGALFFLWAALFISGMGSVGSQFRTGDAQSETSHAGIIVGFDNDQLQLHNDDRTEVVLVKISEKTAIRELDADGNFRDADRTALVSGKYAVITMDAINDAAIEIRILPVSLEVSS